MDIKLWEERRSSVAKIIKSNKIASIADFGCGEGKLISYLIYYFSRPIDNRNNDTIQSLTYILGIDKESNELQKCSQDLNNIVRDFRKELMRQTPFKIFRKKWSHSNNSPHNPFSLPNTRLSQQDLLNKSKFVKDKIEENKVELITMIEVIEHLYPDRIEECFYNLFVFYRVKYIIMTTPNKEYNVHYRLKEDQLRHFDHKFEWTRREFESVCSYYAGKFGYKVRYEGVGDFKEKEGQPTQLAFFTRDFSCDRVINTFFNNPLTTTESSSEGVNFVFNMNYLIYKQEDIRIRLSKFASDLDRLYKKTIKSEFEKENYNSEEVKLEEVFRYYHIRSSFNFDLKKFINFLKKIKRKIRKFGVRFNFKLLSYKCK